MPAKPDLALYSGRYPTASGRAAVLLSSVLGIASLVYPLFDRPAAAAADPAAAHAADAPVLLALLTALCAVAIAAETRTASGPVRQASAEAKLIAFLGVLVALNSALRMLPSFAGASPLFLLILLVGYVYGPVLGYLMGALSLLGSAVITGGFGPWLPYQMLGAGWVGLSAGWLPTLHHRPRLEIVLLAGFGAVWGLLYGAVLNLWFWPFVAPDNIAAETGNLLTDYALFYAITSLGHDIFRSIGSTLLVLALGRPLLLVLRRFRRRFGWTRLPQTAEGIHTTSSREPDVRHTWSSRL